MRQNWRDLEVKLHNRALHLPQLPEDQILFLIGLIACDGGPVSKIPFLKEEFEVRSNLHGVCHLRSQQDDCRDVQNIEVRAALDAEEWLICVCRTTCCEPGVQVAALYHPELSTSLCYLTAP
jgi:hypothetical protein